jgi:hypothetical protein
MWVKMLCMFETEVSFATIRTLGCLQQGKFRQLKSWEHVSTKLDETNASFYPQPYMSKFPTITILRNHQALKHPNLHTFKLQLLGYIKFQICVCSDLHMFDLFWLGSWRYILICLDLLGKNLQSEMTTGGCLPGSWAEIPRTAPHEMTCCLDSLANLRHIRKMPDNTHNVLHYTTISNIVNLKYTIQTLLLLLRGCSSVFFHFQKSNRCVQRTLYMITCVSEQLSRYGSTSQSTLPTNYALHTYLGHPGMQHLSSSMHAFSLSACCAWTSAHSWGSPSDKHRVRPQEWPEPKARHARRESQYTEQEKTHQTRTTANI